MILILSGHLLSRVYYFTIRNYHYFGRTVIKYINVVSTIPSVMRSKKYINRG